MARVQSNIFGALVLGLAAMGMVPSVVQAAEPSETTLWQSRWQYVRIVARDGGMPNLHPSRPGKAEIRSALAQIKLDTGDGEAVEFLTPEERGFYADHLAKALDKAGPGDDVVISTIGMRRTILGLNEQKITTTRLFMAEDGLNVIVGEMQTDSPDDTSTYRRADPRLVSFADGRRSAPARGAGKWKLLANGAGVAVKRPDWVAVSAAAMAVPEPGSEEAQKKTQLQLHEVQQQVQQMQQQMQAVQTAPAAAPASAAPAGAASLVEERLRALDQLKAKGLVTPREYAEKRKKILDSL